MKKRILSFEELVKENKMELMRDEKELDRIELKLEKKHQKQLAASMSRS
ncbi:MAG TPA: FbpB family small basic protein [Bacillus bacterium]|nr:FbpB family small basic protein [Bacillus sp. (in: firmicutes)]